MPLHPTLTALCLLASLPACAAAQFKYPDLSIRALDPDPQISEYIREAFEDRDGNLWLGTNGDGICRFDGQSLTYITDRDGLGGVAIRGILQSADGAMWIATNGGVSRYHDGAFTNYTTAHGLSANEIWSMMLDKAGTLWVGTQEGVCRFDGKAFVPFPLPRITVENPHSRFSPKVVFGLCQDNAGNIWFGTDGEGAHKYDGASFTSYTTSNGLAGNQVRCAFSDSRGNVWLGSDGGGVSRFDGTTFRTFTANDGLGGDRVFLVFEDAAANLWFSILGAGASRYDGKVFTPFHNDRGLTRTHVQCMCQDAAGTLWFGCSGGLFRSDDGESFVNVTRNGPWQRQAPKTNPAPPQPGAAIDPADPMAPFARMIGGEWQVTFASGVRQFDRWAWGPGRHSIHFQTYGADAAGNPWRVIDIYYWDPHRKQVRALGLHPDIRGIGRGVFEGEMSFNAAGSSAEARLDLHQAGYGRRTLRKIARRWTFDGPDTYRSALLEDAGAGFQKLIDPVYTRSKTLTPLPAVDAAAAKPAGALKAFAPFTGQSWEAEGRWTGATRKPLNLRAAFEWIPYCDAVLVRIESPVANGEPLHLLDAIIFQHSATDALRCLALTDSGSVYEGDATALDDGALRLDLTGHEHGQAVHRTVRLDLDEHGSPRLRMWPTDPGASGAPTAAPPEPMLDVRARGASASRGKAR